MTGPSGADRTLLPPIKSSADSSRTPHRPMQPLSGSETRWSLPPGAWSRRGCLVASPAAGRPAARIPQKKGVTPGATRILGGNTWRQEVFVDCHSNYAPRINLNRQMRAIQANCSPILVLELTSNKRLRIRTNDLTDYSVDV